MSGKNKQIPQLKPTESKICINIINYIKVSDL